MSKDFSTFSKKNKNDSGFNFAIHRPTDGKKALLPILVKILNITLNNYFCQFKS